MSLRRFVAYFLVVAVGSTVAFASVMIEHPAPSDMPAAAAASCQTAYSPAPTPTPQSHRNSGKLARIAMAE
jgi:hypothetical protein